jgi:site-specific DNA recombinase
MIQIEQFAKKSQKPQLRETSYCVIYTRVSTKEQAEGNYSLHTQLAACNDYITKKGYIVEGYFGGTYESAQTDERKEFTRMLNFIRKHPNRISYLIVAYPDRFSRSGTKAISIVDDLKSQGVLVESVYQHADVSTQSGQMMQNMQLLFSSYENNNRREKSVNGMIAKLRRGYLVGQAPIGYQYAPPQNGEEQQIIITKEGEYIKKAFLWKANEGLSTHLIAVKLEALGFKVNEKYLSKLFRNPFYCGKIAHGLLDGELAEGKHPKLISVAVFLKAQEELSVNKSNYKTKPEDENLPLKRTLKCGECGTHMTGYLVREKRKYYYKCNVKGCKNNRGAEHLHSLFKTLLDKYGINTALKPLLEKQLMYTYEYLNKGAVEETNLILDSIKTLEAKVTKLEKKYIEDDLSKELYQKYRLEYDQEIRSLKQKQVEGTKTLSNPEKSIQKAVEACVNISKNWLSRDYLRKQQLQQLVFPDGLVYDREKDDYRTPNVNTVFKLIGELPTSSEGIKKGEKYPFDNFSPLVAGSRIELPTLGL